MSEGRGASVFVAMSGGVDSSLSAALLVEQGYEVTGVFLRGWEPEGMPCSQIDDRADAIRVAAKLGVPFITLDVSELYKRQVIDEMLDGYARGETPNPDVLCNKHIKFGAFFNEAVARGAAYVATGHYARVIERAGTFELHAGMDANKDQSYFLWTLTKRELSRTLFPVGEFTKTQVRTMAAARGLPTAAKKDSQGLCFLGSIDVKEFLSRELGLRSGVVLDERGRAIGEHPGAHLFTVGERHGFGSPRASGAREPLYVIRKNTTENTLTAAPAEALHLRARGRLRDINWIAPEPPATGATLAGRFRYRQPLSMFLIEREGEIIRVSSRELLSHGLPIGQSLVLYEGERCLGGGILAP